MTEITIVSPERDFQENFEMVMFQVDTENWTRSGIRETSFIQKGVRLTHREMGKPGKIKTRSAMIRFGFEKYYQDNKDDLELIEKYYDKAINGPAMFSDQISSININPDHQRKVSDDSPQSFYIEDNTHGKIHDLAEALGFSFSELIRHFEAISIADCDFINEPREPAERYKEFLYDYTRTARAPMIRSIMESMSDYKESNGG